MKLKSIVWTLLFCCHAILNAATTEIHEDRICSLDQELDIDTQFWINFHKNGDYEVIKNMVSDEKKLAAISNLTYAIICKKAAACNRADLCSLLFAYSPKKDVPSLWYRLALNAAAKNGCDDVIRFFFSCKSFMAKLTAVDYLVSLAYAVVHENKTTVKIFQNNHEVMDHIRSASSHSCSASDYEIIKKILIAKK